MKLEDAIKHALDGNAVLFLGAGFSIGGTNKLGTSLPTASELCSLMCEELQIDNNGDLALISQRFIDDPCIGRGTDSLINFLKSHLLCTDTTQVQDLIVSLPWLRIYTTNFDNVVEISSKKQGKERESITATIPKYKVRNIDGAIVHMNGSIIKVNEEQFFDEFKITNESYLKQGFCSSPWGDQFVHDLNNCRAIIFIGYSLKYDLEIQRHMNIRIKEKAIFIDRPDLDGNQAYLFGKWGTLYSIGCDGLAKEIRHISAGYMPVLRDKKLEGFEEIMISKYANKKILPNDVLDLLVFGKYDRYSFRATTPFFLKRTGELNKVKRILRTKKICVIHANFGNGKSIFIDYLASQLVEENNVYLLCSTDYLQDDLRIIRNRESTNNIILVDDYDLYMPLFKELAMDFPDNIRVIATSRTSMSDILIERLENDYHISQEDIGVLNIEIIDDNDRKSLVKLLNVYNFWGTNSALSDEQKDSLLNKNYHNRLSHIFYMLLESEVIKSKMEVLFNDLNYAEARKYMLAQSICKICNFKLKGYEIAHLTEVDYSEIEKLSLSPGYKELLLRTDDSIDLRSSVFSQYIVRTTKAYAQLAEILQKLYINSFASFSSEYWYIRQKLISRSNLVEIFGGRYNGNNIALVERDIYNFYNSIQQHAKNNPFFWLQFGITALNLNMHVEARIYFDNAYSYAEELESFDSFQLDTHYARFLLSEILEYDDSFDFEKLTKAHRLLMDNSNAETRLSYVLRQVGIYHKINQKYFDSFTATQRIDFIEYLKEIVIRFEKYFAAIERKREEYFYFAVDNSVRESYRLFRVLLMKTLPPSEVRLLDQKYNRLVKKQDRVRVRGNGK